MNTRVLSAAFVVAVIVSLALGYVAGAWHQKQEATALATGLREHELANTLMVLRYLDSKESVEATKLLQASTSGSLGWIVDHGEPRDGDSLCAVLNTLRAYRAKHRLFVGEEWAQYRALPGIEAEEKKRSAFLERIQCGTKMLYRP
ncbi:hypothetical protein [Usitatibacter palustris]|nr:hypothetical protein [Usitatibacter palustris]